MKTICEKNAEWIAKAKANGATNKQIADMLGVSKNTVRYFCRINGIKTLTSVVHHTHSDDEVAELLSKAAPTLAYIGGYVNNATPMIVGCRVCGAEFTRTFGGIVNRGHTSCPECRRREAEERQAAQRYKKNSKAELAKERRRAKIHAMSDIGQVEMNVCPVCGAFTLRPKFCSNKCRHKAEYKRRELIRDRKIKDAMVDKDITVEGLYKRDGGICYLCGKPCRLDDYVIRDGQKQCGDWYPSIDHVIPLAKGGMHSWDNVRLAHRICNSLKADKELEDVEI